MGTPTLKSDAGYQKVCKRKNLSWLFGADIKIRLSGSLFGITRQSLVMPISDLRTDFSIRTSHPWKILIIYSEGQKSCLFFFEGRFPSAFGVSSACPFYVLKPHLIASCYTTWILETSFWYCVTARRKFSWESQFWRVRDVNESGIYNKCLKWKSGCL